MIFEIPDAKLTAEEQKVIDSCVVGSKLPQTGTLGYWLVTRSKAHADVKVWQDAGKWSKYRVFKSAFVLSDSKQVKIVQADLENPLPF